ncbi:DUF2178 domain-containing protein [Patescibacteria group bacterium]
MTVKTFKKIRAVIIVTTIAITLTSFYFESAFLSCLAVGGSAVILTLLKTRVNGVVEDERLSQIHRRSARTAFNIFLPVLGLTSLALYITPPHDFYYLRALAIILSYVTGLALAIYLVTFAYFSRKMGS